MVIGKKALAVFTHPPFVLDVTILSIVQEPKEMLLFTVHAYIHMYATLLNDELMNKTIKKWNTNISHHERTGLIILNIMVCFYVVQNNNIFKQNQPVAHIYTDTWIDCINY